MAHRSRWHGLNCEFAKLYQKGEYEEAEEMVQELIRIGERTFEREQPELATSLNNIGELYKARGDYQKAVIFRENSREHNIIHPGYTTKLPRSDGFLHEHSQ